MKTSEKIKLLRQKKGLSQEALGELVGVKKAAINKYETGRVVNIKRSILQNLADALGVSPADLLDDGPTNSYDIQTLAAHHNDENWTEEELQEIENFKKYVLSKRKKN